MTADFTVYISSTTPRGDQTIENSDDDVQRKVNLVSVPDKTLLFAVVLLNLVAGSQHAIIKTVAGDCHVEDVTFLRFALASICAIFPSLLSSVPAMPRAGLDHTLSVIIDPVKEAELKNSWRWGAEIGLWMFVGFSLQAVELLTTSGQRSDFLL